MAMSGECGEAFLLLERCPGAIGNLLSNVKEPWLVKGLMQHIARTGSANALDTIVRASDIHVKYALDALQEMLRTPSQARAGVALAARLAARRAPWLPRLAAHPAAKELARLARPGAAAPALDALLALAALVLTAPAAAPSLWPELADALCRLVAWRAPPHVADHLRLALLALFRALYATHPCALLETLRAETAARDDAFRRALAPLVRSVRLHPALLERRDTSRWQDADPLDALDECRDLALDDDEREMNRTSPPALPLACIAKTSPAGPQSGSGALASRRAASLRPGDEPWFCLSERCGEESAPHTPLPVVEGSPPEAAVEATPENTPVKEVRAQFQFPADSACVRALGRVSQPPSPLRKEASPPAMVCGGGDAYGARLARVVLERARESPVPMGGAPPTGPVARPMPRRPPEEPEAAHRPSMATARALTARLRRLAAPSPPPPLIKEPPPSLVRARSCPTLECAPSTRCASSQTVEEWPAPHEFLLAAFFPDTEATNNRVNGETAVGPCGRLDAFLERLYGGAPLVEGGGGGANEREHALREQLALTHAQLLHERWRREAHAERNRRLLGRCRRARAVELENAALKDRLRTLASERDRFRNRPAPAVAVNAPQTAPSPAAAEEAAMARNAAALAAAENGRLEAEEETRRLRAALAEAERKLERAAGAEARAERNAADAQALRAELLLVAERENALRTAARSAAAASAAERRADEKLLRQYRAEESRLRAATAAAVSKTGVLAAREAELEALLSTRESLLAAAGAAARAAEERHAARLGAVQDKYRALMHVLQRVEARRLEAAARPTHAPAQTPPLSEAQLQELRNLRDMLED